MVGKSILAGAGVMVVLATAALAADWPQFRGPSHDSSSSEQGLAWPAGELTVVWRVPMGAGYSGITVVKDKACCFAMRGDQEVALGLDASTGKELWATPIDKTFRDNNVDGPRSTPGIDGDRVYYFSTHQKLFSLGLSDGAVIWSHDVAKEFSGHTASLGNATSPMIDGNLVFVCAGGAGQSLLAFDKTSGQVVWKGEDDRPTHATPVPATIGGVRQVIFRTQKGLVGVEEQTGHVLWRQTIEFREHVGASPVVADDIVYCTANYGIGAVAVKLTKSESGFAVKELWRQSGRLQNRYSTAVYHDGYLYGLYESPSSLRCIDMNTGREIWSRNGFGSGGATILVDGRVLVQDEEGGLVLVAASPTAFHELGRWPGTKARSWTMPAFSGGRIFIRNVKEAACLDVSAK